MRDLLIIAAAAFEVEPLLAGLRARGLPFEFAAAGIGSLTAAENAQILANSAAGRHVIFVGTAGIFSGFSTPFLCRPGRVVWLPTCERLGVAYGIPRGQVPSYSPRKLTHVSSGLEPFDVICGPSISLTEKFSDEHRKQFRPDKTVENLELFSCLRHIEDTAACVDVILGITNQIGQNAHEQWKKWHVTAAEMAATSVLKEIEIDRTPGQ